MNLARIYLRASTSEQNAKRALACLQEFAKERALHVVGTYAENESGTKLRRPELFRLLNDCQPGDMMLIEGVDRLSRLSDSDWRQLRHEIDEKQIRVVSMDLPTSWSLAGSDDFSGRMLAAINGMMLDMLAAISRKDYEDRRRRQAQGIAKAKTEGRFKGRPEDVGRNAAISKMLGAKVSWTQIQETVGCSRATVAKVAQREREYKSLSG